MMTNRMQSYYITISPKSHLEIVSFIPPKKNFTPESLFFKRRHHVLGHVYCGPKYRIQACEHRCSETLRQAQNLLTGAHRPVANGDDHPTTAAFRGTKLVGDIPQC